MGRPLQGITVVTLEHAIAAPLCTRHLADLGARVIKVERPGAGDFARGYDDRVKGLASHFVWTNRSKESLTLDVKHREASAVLDALLARADVLVQNLAPGAAARLGLSFETLHARWPRLIVCDIAAGMYAYSAILAALIERGKSGQGVRLDVSMLESMAEWMSFPLYYAYDGAAPPPRAGAAHATIFPYGPFPAGDGHSVMLGLQNDREWQVFCAKVLQQPELASDPRFDTNARRVAARDALTAIIDEVFSKLSSEQVVQRLDAAQIANAHVNGMREVWAHPQLAARERWTEVASPAGAIPALKPPALPVSFDSRMDAIPALGQHTDAVLAEFGFDEATVARWRRDGVV